MITFFEYLNKIEIPRIHCSIRDENLIEEFKEIEGYHQFIGKENDIPDGKHLGFGLYYTPNHKDGKLYHHADGKGFDHHHDGELYSHNKKRIFDENITNLSKSLVPNINEKENDSLKDYSSAAIHINKSLMNNEPIKSKDRKRIDNIDSAMNKNKIKKDMIVYTGISNEHHSKIINNDIVHHPSFLSTSLDPHVASFFSEGGMLKIHVPGGHNGIYMNKISQHKHEHEFLLPRNLKLRIHHDKTEYHDGTEGVSPVYHATIEN